MDSEKPLFPYRQCPGHPLQILQRSGLKAWLLCLLLLLLHRVITVNMLQNVKSSVGIISYVLSNYQPEISLEGSCLSQILGRPQFVTGFRKNSQHLCKTVG